MPRQISETICIITNFQYFITEIRKVFMVVRKDFFFFFLDLERFFSKNEVYSIKFQKADPNTYVI